MGRAANLTMAKKPFAFLTVLMGMAEHTDNQQTQMRSARRELHFMYGENPIFIPKHQKRKGYIKDACRDNRYNKFRKHAN